MVDDDRPVPPWRTAVYRFGLRALRGADAPDGELTPGALVVGKDAGPDRLTLWVGAFLPGRREPTVPAVVTVSVPGGSGVPDRTVEVALSRYDFDSERRRTGFSPDNSFYHRHVDVDGLPRGADVEVRVEVDGEHRAGCTTATLPRPPAVGDTLDLFTASCYDVGTDPDAQMDALYHRVWGGRRPDLTLLTGDQVYLDAPWWFFALLARNTPRTYYLMKYWTTWGGDPGVPGLRSLLTQGPTWFLPDDHEFWNNWPHRSVTAFHSFANIGKGLVSGLLRQWPLHWLAHDETPPALDDPDVPPTDPVRQNYLPVHPDEWGGWSRGAFDLIGSFQTRGPADRADPTRIPRGEDPWPSAPGPRGAPAPLNDLCQRIDLGPVQVVLLDTRTRRTRSHQHPTAQFTDPEALTAMLATAGADETDVLVLTVPQPILRAAKYPKQSTWFGRLVDHAFDRGLEDYWYQYERFWRALVAARRGRPTVVLCGDIHQCWISHVESLGLVEVVASPMSLVSSPWLLDRATSLLTAAKTALAGPADDPAVREFFAGPSGEPAPVDGTIARCAKFGEGHPGVADLTLTRETETGYRLDVTLYRRRMRAGEPIIDDPEHVRRSFTLTVPPRRRP